MLESQRGDATCLSEQRGANREGGAGREVKQVDVRERHVFFKQKAVSEEYQICSMNTTS